MTTPTETTDDREPVYYGIEYPGGRRSIHYATTKAEAEAHACGPMRQLRVFGRGPAALALAQAYAAVVCEAIEAEVDAPFIVTVAHTG